MPLPQTPLRNYLLLSLAMGFTGATVAIAKPLAAAMPVFLLGFLRCVIAAAALAPFALKDLKSARQGSRTGLELAWRPLLGQTLTGVFLFTSFLFFGVRASSALTAGIITATLPAAVALLSVVWLKERLSPLQLLAVALAVFGVGLVNLAGTGHEAGASLLGTVLLVLAVFSEAAYTIFAKQTAEHLAPIPTAFLVNALGAALFLLPGGWQGLGFDWSQMTPGLWALVFCFALGSSVFALIFWYMGVKGVASSVAGLFTAVMPVAAGAVAIGFLGERLSLAEALGAFCVLAAIFMGSRARRG